MKIRTVLIAAAAAGGAAMTGCGGSDHASAMLPGPSAPAGQAFATAQVLAQARQPSETAEPYAINDGAVSLTDASETSEPIALNAP